MISLNTRISPITLAACRHGSVSAESIGASPDQLDVWTGPRWLVLVRYADAWMSEVDTPSASKRLTIKVCSQRCICRKMDPCFDAECSWKLAVSHTPGRWHRPTSRRSTACRPGASCTAQWSA